MGLVKCVNINAIGDGRGELYALEASKNVPFSIKRVYYMTGLHEDVSRGYHAHKSLQQLAVCVSGSCRFILDDGITREDIVLDSPRTGLLIGNMIWREMHDFTEGCVLMVLASEYYDEFDYIRDYQDFLSVVKHG